MYLVNLKGWERRFYRIGCGVSNARLVIEFHLSQQEASGLARGRNAAALENRLGPGELITGFHVPVDPASQRSAYLKVRERASYEYAMVSAAVAIDLEAGKIRTARIALGSVAQKPWRLREAETALRGQILDAEAMDRALEQSLAAARPLAGNEFKVRLARNAARRALMMAGGVA